MALSRYRTVCVGDHANGSVYRTSLSVNRAVEHVQIADLVNRRVCVAQGAATDLCVARRASQRSKGRPASNEQRIGQMVALSQAQGGRQHVVPRRAAVSRQHTRQLHARRRGLPFNTLLEHRCDSELNGQHGRHSGPRGSHCGHSDTQGLALWQQRPTRLTGSPTLVGQSRVGAQQASSEEHGN